MSGNLSRNDESSNWRDLPEVYVRLRKDELGYPPKEWEQLKAEPTEKPDVYRLKSIPFYARGLAYDDQILVTTSQEGYFPVYRSVVSRSGYSTMRLMIAGNEDHQKLIEYFTQRDTFLEFLGNLVALAIPRRKFEEVSDFIVHEKQNGRWDAEDGFLIVDDPGGERR
jgi:hypothetical protein